ncbi:MAG: isopeptide-forming domain-containing fimbrial protein, partial [Erysipelotrichaceae bacterium]|nr:isopeptide-forming domain-containing fimbrial protein [Erysipelotrichaceae bacterium]
MKHHGSSLGKRLAHAMTMVFTVGLLFVNLLQPLAAQTKNAKTTTTVVSGVTSSGQIVAVENTEPLASRAPLKFDPFDVTDQLNTYSMSTYFAANSGDKDKLVVVGLNSAAGYTAVYTEMSATGLKAALWDIYHQPDGGDYIIYFGKDVDISAYPGAVRYTTDAPKSDGSDISFMHLAGKVGTIVLTGNASDPLDNTNIPTSEPSSSTVKKFRTGTDAYFGVNITIRNLRYSFSSVYMMGNDLTLAGGAYATSETRYYGGSKNGTVVAGGDGTATMNIWSTGYGYAYFYGGMKEGDFYGDIEINFHNSGKNEIFIYGGGEGYSVTSRANVYGNVTNNILGLHSTSQGLKEFYGAGKYVNVHGKVKNTMSGKGSFIENKFYFFGGALAGDIGTDDTKGTSTYVIDNDIDISNYSYGSMYYFGANREAGTIKGSIKNVFKASDKNVYNGAVCWGWNGGGYWSTYLNNSINTDNITVYEDLNNPDTYGTVKIDEAKIEEKAAFKVYGNIDNEIKSGHFGGAFELYKSYIRGAGYGGYIQGNVTTRVGTEGLVWGQTRTSDTNYQAVKNCYGDQNNTNIAACYSNTVNNRFQTGWLPDSTGHLDIVGGGGEGLDDKNRIFIKGNTTVVLENVLARWTYGGNFDGVLVGDSTIILKKGIVQTIEGGGYHNWVQVGSTHVIIEGGQVDFFVSGGSWRDTWLTGEASIKTSSTNAYQKIVLDEIRTTMEVQDNPRLLDNGTPLLDAQGKTLPAAVINASFGASYGDTYQVLRGSSSVVIYGGDFSGSPDHGFDGISGAITKKGWLIGNSEVTIDVRGNQNGFALPTRDTMYLTAGRPYNVNNDSILGKLDGSSTITLNILADDNGRDVLSGISIFGDGGTEAAGTYSNKIIININAPDSTVGKIYATQYSNLSSTDANKAQILRDVDIHLVSAKTIQGLSAGNPDDGFTNKIYSNSVNGNGHMAEIHVGPQSEDPENILAEREDLSDLDYPVPVIGVSGIGIINFTSMDVHERIIMATGTGKVLNGKSATDTNHASTYDDFGDLTLIHGGIGVTLQNTTLMISIGSVTVLGGQDAYIVSPGGANQIHVTDFNVNEEDGNRLVWYKIGNVSQATNLMTTYFGQQNGYRVLTFTTDNTANGQNLSKINAGKITPANFGGVDQNTKKTYIGDNDVHESSNVGYGVAIPGSFYRFTVLEGKGTISHNVDNVSLVKPSSGYMKVYGYPAKNIETKSGYLAIPTNLDPYPEVTFKFTPNSGLGEWIKSLDIDRTDNNAAAERHETEQTLAQYNLSQANRIYTWTSSQATDKEYGFEITVRYTNKAEVFGKSVIITESQAALIQTADDVLEVTGGGGRPFFTHNISDTKINALHASIGAAGYIEVEFRYHAGTSGDTVDLDVSIIVVPDDAIIDASKQIALVAHDAGVQIPEARLINSRAALDAKTGAIVIDVRNDTTIEPALVSESQKLNAIASATVTTSIPLTYYYIVPVSSERLEKTVDFAITGGSISGVLFEDLNGNGVKDENETVVFSGKSVKLYDVNNMSVPVATQLTDTEGKYYFEVEEKQYVVVFADLAPYSLTNIDPISRQSDTMTVSYGNSGVYNYVVNAGYGWPDISSIEDSLLKEIYNPQTSSYESDRTLYDSAEVLQYRISFTLPSDLTGYGKLVVADWMQPGLRLAADENEAVVLVIDGSETVLTSEQYTVTTVSENSVTYQVVSVELTDFTGLQDKTVELLVKAKLEKVNGSYPVDIINKVRVTVNPFEGAEITEQDQKDKETVDISDKTGPNVDNKGLIYGVIFKDENRDNTYQSSEAVLNGVTVKLLDVNGQVIGTTTSDAQGKYSFEVAAGTYGLQFADQVNSMGLIDSTLGNKKNGIVIQLGENQQYEKNVGYNYPTSDSLNDLGDSFKKEIYDGADYVSETTIYDATAELTYRLSFEMPSDLSGYYSIEVKDVMAQGLTLSNKAGNIKVTIDGNEVYSSPAGISGNTASYVIAGADLRGLEGKEVIMTVTAVAVKIDGSYLSDLSNKGVLVVNEGGSIENPIEDKEVDGPSVSSKGLISGYVFNDLDSDGLFDSDETAISNIEVKLLANDEVIASVTTNADGKYSFEVPAGTYALQFPVKVDDKFPTNIDLDGLVTSIQITLGSADVQTYFKDAGYTDVVVNQDGFKKELIQIGDELSSGPIYNAADELTYAITYVMPSSVNGYASLEIVDTMSAGLSLKDGSLDFVTIKIEKDGSILTGYSGTKDYKASGVNGDHYVSYVFAQGTDFSAFADATITMTIVAVQDNTNGYGAQVANSAKLIVNKHESTSVEYGPVITDNKGLISGYAYLDANNNGVKDESEAGIANITVTLSNGES